MFSSPSRHPVDLTQRLHNTCVSFDIIFAVILAAQPLCREEQHCQVSSLCSIYLTDWRLIEVSVFKKCFTGLFHSSLVRWDVSFRQISVMESRHWGNECGNFFSFFFQGQSIGYFNKCDDTGHSVITFVEITVFNHSTQIWSFRVQMFSGECM